MSDSLPVALACDLSALDPEARQRHQVVSQQLFQLFQAVEEQPAGYRFHLRVDHILLAAEFITRERVCCPFFNFMLNVPSAGDSIWLELAGGEGVKDFILVELGVGS